MNELNLRAHAIAGNRFVMEGGYFDFDRIVPILKTYGIEEMKERFLLIGLVQNQKTADGFFRDFRKHDTEDDWTYGMSDDDLREISRDAVSFSRSMTERLQQHGFAIYDTSAGREQVLTRIVSDIKAQQHE